MQEEHWGKDKLKIIPDFLSKKSFKRVFLVTGRKSYTNSSAKDIIDALLEKTCCIRFSDFSENPKDVDVLKGVEFFKRNKCDLIIAIGGGSVMDMAKLIKAFQNTKGSLSENIIHNTITANNIPLITIPTTAGSGSESTHFAVAYVNNQKYSVADNSLLPNKTFLVPELTYSTSAYLTAVTGLDAFSQAIESWWSINSSATSISYSKKACSIIWTHLFEAINGNLQAKDNILEAAHLSGKAINITKTTAPHALSYGFTTFCALPHGHAVALFLPNFIKLHQTGSSENCIDKRGITWLNNIMKDISATLNVQFAQLPSEIARFISKCGININFKELNISHSQYKMAIGAFSPERLKNNPVKIENRYIEDLFNSEFNN